MQLRETEGTDFTWSPHELSFYKKNFLFSVSYTHTHTFPSFLSFFLPSLPSSFFPLFHLPIVKGNDNFHL